VHLDANLASPATQPVSSVSQSVPSQFVGWFNYTKLLVTISPPDGSSSPHHRATIHQLPGSSYT